MNSAKVIQVIETMSTVGKGIPPDDPIRPLIQYWSLEGKLLATNDPLDSVQRDDTAAKP